MLDPPYHTLTIKEQQTARRLAPAMTDPKTTHVHLDKLWVFCC